MSASSARRSSEGGRPHNVEVNIVAERPGQAVYSMMRKIDGFVGGVEKGKIAPDRLPANAEVLKGHLADMQKTVVDALPELPRHAPYSDEGFYSPAHQALVLLQEARALVSKPDASGKNSEAVKAGLARVREYTEQVERLTTFTDKKITWPGDEHQPGQEMRVPQDFNAFSADWMKRHGEKALESLKTFLADRQKAKPITANDISPLKAIIRMTKDDPTTDIFVHDKPHAALTPDPHVMLRATAEQLLAHLEARVNTNMPVGMDDRRAVTLVQMMRGVMHISREGQDRLAKKGPFQAVGEDRQTTYVPMPEQLRASRDTMMALREKAISPQETPAAGTRAA